MIAIRLLTLILLVLILSACDSEHVNAIKDSGVDTRKRIETNWPRIGNSQVLCQVTKHKEDLLLNSTLAILTDFPAKILPNDDIKPLDIENITAQEVELLMDSKKWLLIDTRKAKDLIKGGQIPGSVHYEYKFEKAKYKGDSHFTFEHANSLLEKYEGLILVCNGQKCSRSFNAALAMVQSWGISSGRVKWFGAGVGSWERSVLIPYLKRGE